MREVLKGIVSDGYAAFERRSDRPEVGLRPFNPTSRRRWYFYVSPDTEGDLQEIVDYRFRAALA